MKLHMVKPNIWLWNQVREFGEYCLFSWKLECGELVFISADQNKMLYVY